MPKVRGMMSNFGQAAGPSMGIGGFGQVRLYVCVYICINACMGHIGQAQSGSCICVYVCVCVCV
jgi:hypothetical protein